jgi:RHS repeat-associated protein
MIQETGLNQHSSLYIYTDQSSYEPLARIDKRGNDPEKVMYFHTDLNGCPEELTDENGKILWECSFQLWGKRIHEIEHEPIEQNLRYQGQHLDRETGLHYNTFRYYDPDIGRFTQPDPIGLLGGFNLYQYAPNAFGWIDPLGWSKCSNFENKDKLNSHFKKHGGEFGAKTKQEYLDIGHYVVKNGYKVQYPYKGELRTGYVSYMGNTSKGATKIGFVGTNSEGHITTIHTKSGKDIWKTLNGDAKDTVLKVIPRDANGL